MKILIQQHSLIEMARVLSLKLNHLGKTKYSYQIRSIFDEFSSSYSPTLSVSALNTLKELQKDLEILERVKKSDKIDNDITKMIARIEDELARIIQIQQAHEELITKISS